MPGERKGLIILGVIIVIVIAGSLIAFHKTGDRSIEDRFLDAAGIHGDDNVASGENGFSLEGNPLLYIGILAGLAVACIVIYRQFRL